MTDQDATAKLRQTRGLLRMPASKGWRWFLAEYVVVFIGVLTALGAEQAVQTFHERSQQQEAEEALASELFRSSNSALARMRTAECVDQKLDALGAIIDEAATARRLPPMAPFGRVRNPILSTSTWTGVIASPAGTHFGVDKLSQLRDAYTHVHELQETANREMPAWDKLWTMVGPGRPLAAGEDLFLREALIVARSENLQFGVRAMRLFEVVGHLDLPFTREQKKQLAEREKAPLVDVDITGICQTTKALPPPHYGQTPNSRFLSLPVDALRAGVRLGPGRE